MSVQRIVLSSHDVGWRDAFEREAAAVTHSLGDALDTLHHIGSTAIPGIHAKPVIDMLAVTADLARLDARADRLVALGYEALGEFGIAGRRYFRKDDPEGVRTHQIHAFEAGSPQIARHLAFRDYLIAHPEVARAYDALKHRLAAIHPHDTRRYTEGKGAFIADVDAKAAAWVGRAASRGEGIARDGGA